MAAESLARLNASRKAVARESEEYGRSIRDNQCLVRFARFCRAKLEAAIEKGRFDSSGDTAHYKKVLSSWRRASRNTRPSLELRRLLIGRRRISATITSGRRSATPSQPRRVSFRKRISPHAEPISSIRAGRTRERCHERVPRARECSRRFGQDGAELCVR